MKPKEIRLQLKALVPAFAKRVAPIYKQLGWEWRPKNLSFVPTEEDITKELYKLIDGVEFAGGEGNLSTGGLKVFSEPPNAFDTCWNIGLRFELKHEAIIGVGGRCVSISGKR